MLQDVGKLLERLGFSSAGVHSRADDHGLGVLPFRNAEMAAEGGVRVLLLMAKERSLHQVAVFQRLDDWVDFYLRLLGVIPLAALFLDIGLDVGEIGRIEHGRLVVRLLAPDAVRGDHLLIEVDLEVLIKIHFNLY